MCHLEIQSSCGYSAPSGALPVEVLPFGSFAASSSFVTFLVAPAIICVAVVGVVSRSTLVILSAPS